MKKLSLILAVLALSLGAVFSAFAEGRIKSHHPKKSPKIQQGVKEGRMTGRLVRRQRNEKRQARQSKVRAVRRHEPEAPASDLPPAATPDEQN